MVNEAITLAKETKTDIFGFGNLIYKKDYIFIGRINYIIIL